MNEICIISADTRYDALCDILISKGYNARICAPDMVTECDALILPIKSALTDTELSKIFKSVKGGTLVFSGEVEKIKPYFKGQIINYSANEDFIDKNAYITAECALLLVLSSSKKTICKRECAIVGYGRIGKHLTRILRALGANVTVFARREQSRAEAIKQGALAYKISELTEHTFDFIFNTVPMRVISKEQSDKIPSATIAYDLASLPGGFEDEDYPIRALALPGKMMPESSAEAIYDFLLKYIERK